MSKQTTDGGYSEAYVRELEAEIERLRAERDELLAALRELIEISMRNSEPTLMLIGIRRCAEHAIAKVELSGQPEKERSARQ